MDQASPGVLAAKVACGANAPPLYKARDPKGCALRAHYPIALSTALTTTCSTPCLCRPTPNFVQGTTQFVQSAAHQAHRKGLSSACLGVLYNRHRPARGRKSQVSNIA